MSSALMVKPDNIGKAVELSTDASKEARRTIIQ